MSYGENSNSVINVTERIYSSERGGFEKKNIEKEFSDSYFFSQSDKADIRDLIEAEGNQKSKKLLFYKALHYINISRQKLNFSLLSIPENSTLC